MKREIVEYHGRDSSGNPTRKITATRVGPFGVHRDVNGREGFSASHIGNGRFVLNAKTERKAIALAERMAAIPAPWNDIDGVSFVADGDWPEDILRAVYAIRAEGRETYLRKPRKAKGESA